MVHYSMSMVDRNDHKRTMKITKKKGGEEISFQGTSRRKNDLEKENVTLLQMCKIENGKRCKSCISH